jgi:hypothetical protein
MLLAVRLNRAETENGHSRTLAHIVAGRIFYRNLEYTVTFHQLLKMITK